MLLRILKKIFKNSDKENIDLIRKSKYFDEKYYRLENPKVKGDLCTHYYYYGWKEGKSPSFEFSNNFYLKNYKDVEDASINPLLHYLKFGKAENRLIEKDNGLTLKKIYEKVYGCAYFYKTYIHDTDIKRVNLFFDIIDNEVEKFVDLISYVVKFCQNYNYQFRIIYFMADFEILKKVLEENEIVLPKDTIFLNLKSSNYLEVGLNERYICTSWKNARALLNTSSVNANVYYYLPDNLKELSKEEYYQISNICMNDHVIIMAREKKTVESLKSCKLKFEVSSVKLPLKDVNQLYCDFNGMFIVGVELLNTAFLSGVLDSKSWRVNILESENDFKFHFDTNVSIMKVNKIDMGADLIFNLSYNKKKFSSDRPYLNAWVEEKNIKISNFILLSETKFSKLLCNEEFSISTIDNNYQEFQNYILMLKDKG